MPGSGLGIAALCCGTFYLFVARESSPVPGGESSAVRRRHRQRSLLRGVTGRAAQPDSCQRGVRLTFMRLCT